MVKLWVSIHPFENFTFMFVKWCGCITVEIIYSYGGQMRLHCCFVQRETLELICYKPYLFSCLIYRFYQAFIPLTVFRKAVILLCEQWIFLLFMSLLILNSQSKFSFYLFIYGLIQWHCFWLIFQMIRWLINFELERICKEMSMA